MRRDKELDALMESMPPETALAIFMRDQAGMSESRMRRELTGASTHQRNIEGNGKWPTKQKRSGVPEPKSSEYINWLLRVQHVAKRVEAEYTRNLGRKSA